MKLGRRAVKRDPRTPSLAVYMRHVVVPPPPPAVDWYTKVPSWPVDLNDSIGDCTIAAASHAIQQWSTYAQPSPLILSDAQVLSAYEAVSGYNPAIPSSDIGATEFDVLHYWLRTGIGGNTLRAFAALNITNPFELKDSISWFGNAYIGFNCPQSALDNVKVWDVVPGSPIVGGHAVILVGYDASYFYAVSWGMLIPVTPAFLLTYMDEAYGLIDRIFLAQGTTPGGLNLTQLEADLSVLKHG